MCPLHVPVCRGKKRNVFLCVFTILPDEPAQTQADTNTATSVHALFASWVLSDWLSPRCPSQLENEPALHHFWIYFTFSRPVPLSSQSSGCQRLWGSNEKNLNKRERKKTIRLCRKDLFSSMTSHRPHINLSFFQCYNSTLVSSAHRIVSLSTLWGH